LKKQNPWESRGKNRYQYKQHGDEFIKVIRKTRGKTPEGKYVWFTEEKFEKVIPSKMKVSRRTEYISSPRKTAAIRI
jgi:hypothetical protein